LLLRFDDWVDFSSRPRRHPPRAARLEGVELLGPEDAMAFHPFLGALHRPGIEGEEVLATRHAAAHELRALEDADVLETELSEMSNGSASSVTRASPLERRCRMAGGWDREGDQGVVEVHGCIINPLGE